MGPSPLSSTSDGAHPNSRSARSITGWRWRGSSCESDLQIISNDRIALKAVTPDQTPTTAAHNCRAGNPFWPSRFGKHNCFTSVGVIHQAREMGLGLVHVDQPLLRSMAKTSSAPSSSGRLKKVNVGSAHFQDELNICKALEVSIHAEEPSLMLPRSRQDDAVCHRQA